MILPRAGDRPLSALWAEDQRRLHARELNAIIALHRANYQARRLAVEAEKRQHKESLS